MKFSFVTTEVSIILDERILLQTSIILKEGNRNFQVCIQEIKEFKWHEVDVWDTLRSNSEEDGLFRSNIEPVNYEMESSDEFKRSFIYNTNDEGDSKDELYK